MTSMQTFSATDIATANNTTKWEITENALQANNGKQQDLDPKSCAFNNVLGGLLPAASSMELVDKIDDLDQTQEVSLAEEDEELLPNPNANPALTVANPILLPVENIASQDVDLQLLANNMESLDHQQQYIELTSNVSDHNIMAEIIDSTVQNQETSIVNTQLPTTEPLTAPLELTIGQPVEAPGLAADLLAMWQKKTGNDADLIDDTASPTLPAELQASVANNSANLPQVQVTTNDELEQKIILPTTTVTITAPLNKETTPSTEALNQANDPDLIPQVVPAEADDQRPDRTAAKFGKKNISLVSEYKVSDDLKSALEQSENAQRESGANISRIQIFDSFKVLQQTVRESSSRTHSSNIFTTDGIFANTEMQDLAAGLNMHTADWENSLGHKMLWMSRGDGMKRLSIQIEPPELGPLGVQIRVVDNKANFTFTSHNHEVKGIIESATPRLQRIFDEQGFGLGQVNVNISSNQFNGSDRGFQQQPRQTEYVAGRAASNGLVSSNDGVEQSRIISHRGLIDYFA